MAAATLADPDGATADADKPVIACHVFDSPKPTFRGAVGSGGQQLGDTMVGAGFCSGMTSVMSPMVNPEPVSPRGSPPLVVTGKPTFVERAPAGGASRLRLRGRGPVGAVRKRRVRYKSRPWEVASMTWRDLALSKSIPPPTLLFPRWRLACRKRV